MSPSSTEPNLKVGLNMDINMEYPGLTCLKDQMKSKQDGAELSDDILELFENSEELLYTDEKWLIL